MVEENETVEDLRPKPPLPPEPPLVAKQSDPPSPPPVLTAEPIDEAKPAEPVEPATEAAEPRIPSPTLTKLRAVAGPLGGGTRVVLEGSGFVDGCEVKVDRVPVKVTFVGPTELAFTTLPRNLPGAVDVDVVNPDGQRTLLLRAYEYCAPPVLTGIEPDHAPETGAVRVTLLGADLRPDAEVRIGASRPRVDYRGPTRIDLELLAHPAGTYDVELANPDGQQARLDKAFRYDGRPRVDRLVPDHGPVGATTRLIIEGEGFRTGCVVYLGGARIPAELESSSRIAATALARETPGPVALRITNVDGLAAERADAFRYDPPAGPRIAALSPARVPRAREQKAIVTGEGFTEGCSVRVEGSPAPTRFVSPTQLEVSLPALDRIGWVAVEVASADQPSHTLEAAYELHGPPQLAGVTPREGSCVGGDLLTLTGLGFDRACEVSIGGFPAKTSWEADHTVRAVVPQRALAGEVDVVLTNPDGQTARLGSVFTYVARRAAVVTSLEPKTGPTTGGTGVLLRGEGLDAVAHVRVGGEPAGFKARAGELAFATPPRGHEGAVDVELITRDKASTVLKNAFTYAPVPPPAITSITPNRGGPGGGTEVTIAGEHFAPGMSVLVDGERVPVVKVRNATTIVFTTPKGESGAMADVAVRSPTGQQAVVKRAFLYDPRYA
jgi:hypothetical protein